MELKNNHVISRNAAKAFINDDESLIFLNKAMIRRRIKKSLIFTGWIFSNKKKNICQKQKTFSFTPIEI